MVAVAALRRADLATGADHSALIARWVDRARARADPGTGLLPHETDPVTGRRVSGARGSSQSLIQRFWPLLDPAGAPTSYRRFRSVFVTRRFGVVGVREYPAGVAGGGDVDSGPLLAGLSMSATAVAIGAARSNGDVAVAVSLTHEADVFGVPVRWWGTRRHLLGAVPIADAFLAWARATPYPPPGSATGTSAAGCDAAGAAGRSRPVRRPCRPARRSALSPQPVHLAYPAHPTGVLKKVS
ncbi:hypothetical protein [Frankia sp. QA3]|uniref:hypothetical protein n=1 Tax=Frankia sp. QA3 TaxID=710111 RepID=UPI000269BF10|nr:hypothetical protein [Frankia sp. QA3]EIV92732.1 hypothetical protein FraQA3DRAFT_2344 [Frankia sp. QA3]